MAKATPANAMRSPSDWSPRCILKRIAPPTLKRGPPQAASNVPRGMRAPQLQSINAPWINLLFRDVLSLSTRPDAKLTLTESLLPPWYPMSLPGPYAQSTEVSLSRLIGLPPSSGLVNSIFVLPPSCRTSLPESCAVAVGSSLTPLPPKSYDVS